MANTTERPNHSRRRVAVPAKLYGLGVAPRGAIVRDVARKDIYLECKVTLAEVAEPNGALIGKDGIAIVEFSLELAGEAQKFVVEGSTCRISQLGLWVVFSQGNTSGALAALSE